jgi:hypothetical protein
MSETILKSYPYKPKVGTMAAAVLLFGACAAVLAIKASTNDRGLILDSIIELGVENATAFYWVLAVLSLAFAATGLLFFVGSAGGTAHLSITPTEVRIPHGFFRLKRSVNVIPFAEVKEISETTVHGQQFLNLHTPKRKHSLARSMMPSDHAYEEAKKLIAEMVAAGPEPVVDSNICPKSAPALTHVMGR